MEYRGDVYCCPHTQVQSRWELIDGFGPTTQYTLSHSLTHVGWKDSSIPAGCHNGEPNMRYTLESRKKLFREGQIRRGNKIEDG